MREPPGQLMTLHLLHSSIGLELWVEGSCGSWVMGQRNGGGERDRWKGFTEGTPPSGPPPVGWPSPTTWVVALDPLHRLYGQSGDELIQHQLVDDLVHFTSLDHQSSAARIPVLLGQHKGPATFTQVQ